MNLTLKERWEAFHDEHPGVSLKDAALQIGATEVELFATFIDAGATPLANNLSSLRQSLAALSDLSYLTQKPHASLEQRTKFSDKYIRLAPGKIMQIFALREEGGTEVSFSIHFFNGAGAGILRAYLPPGTTEKIFDELLTRHQTS